MGMRVISCNYEVSCAINSGEGLKVEIDQLLYCRSFGNKLVN